MATSLPATLLSTTENLRDDGDSFMLERCDDGGGRNARLSPEVRTQRRRCETAKERRLPGRDAPDEGTENTKKKTSSRASAVYISISVIAENAKKETPNAQPPLMADKIRAGYK